MVPELLSLLVREISKRYEAGNATNSDWYTDHGLEHVSQGQEGKNRKLGANPKTFTEAEERRITRAIKENESIGKVAKEMGRTYRSILAKMWRRKRAMTTVSKGRFSAEEDSRTRLAVENGEDYRKVTHKFELSWGSSFNFFLQVAIELGRDVTSVRTRMNRLKMYPESSRMQTREAGRD